MKNSLPLKLPPRRNIVPPPPPPPPNSIQRKSVRIGKTKAKQGHRIVLYGPAGIGKTTLCSSLPDPAFFDLDDALAHLRHVEANMVEGIQNWSDLRGALQGDGWDGVGTIVIDSATKAEDLATDHMFSDFKNEGGKTVTSIEGYGYGKGYVYLYETFMPLLSDLDRHVREGRNVVLVCHDCTCHVPNPDGQDWIRYEPRLQSPPSGKSSIRLRVREWANHLLFMSYDVNVTKERKGQGSGTRTIYTSELPWLMAKSHSTTEPFPLNDDPEEFWSTIIPS
jgi:hypothetical protein